MLHSARGLLLAAVLIGWAGPSATRAQSPPSYPWPPPSPESGYPATGPAYPVLGAGYSPFDPSLPLPVQPVGTAPLAGQTLPAPPNDVVVEPLPAEALTAPIELPAEPVYSWYEPAYWFAPDIWDGSFELGINGNEGNATAFNFISGFDLKRETDATVLDVQLDYAKNSSRDALLAHYALLDARNEWKFGDSPWSIFMQETVRYDEFQNYDLRFTVNSGLSYRFYDTVPFKLKGRFGAGGRRDFGGPDESWIPEAVFGVDYFYQISDRQKLKSKLDYYPNWTDFADYRLVIDTSWEMLLDESTNLSLKVGVINIYDSTPEGARPSDLYYNILLLWKL